MNNRQDAITMSVQHSSKIALMRILIGLFQGGVLFFLDHFFLTSPAFKTSFLLQSLWFLSCILPVIWIVNLGYLNKKQISIWLALITLGTTSIIAYSHWRAVNLELTFSSYLCIGLIWCFAQPLIFAAVQEKRYIASYSSYFEVAWKWAIQLLFSTFFTGLVILCLNLGAGLFELIKLYFLSAWMMANWFMLPVMAFAFAWGLHVTDIRHSTVQSIRAFLLILLSWLLPLVTLITVGFLISLLVIGVTPLWVTGKASLILFGLASLIVLLINAAYQNGEANAEVKRAIRISARVAAFTLVPLAILSIYSLSLRVHAHAWTTDRVFGAAYIAVISCYALGYLRAACQFDRWLSFIERVNVTMAIVIISLLLLLQSPIIDPVRIGVNSQMQRLLNGQINAQQFDYEYLKNKGQRYGVEALKKLTQIKDLPDAETIRKKAQSTLDGTMPETVEREERGPLSEDEILSNIRVWPESEKLPSSLLQQKEANSNALPDCFRYQGSGCDAYIMAATVGKPTTILLHSSNQIIVLRQNDAGFWIIEGDVSEKVANCDVFKQSLRKGKFELKPVNQQSLMIGEQYIPITSIRCPE